MKKFCYLDIETDGLDANVIWCAVAFTDEGYLIYHVASDEQINYPARTKLFTDLSSWVAAISAYTPVAHNGVQFDYRVLKKLAGYSYDLSTVVDTHILSRLFNPDRDGHSLSYWGDRLGFSKGDHSDWSRFSADMLTYCIRDVDVLYRLHQRLIEEAGDWDWSESIRLENYVWDVMARQEAHGVLFDAAKAESVLSSLDSEIVEIEAKVLAEVPKRVIRDPRPITKPFKKDGSLTKQVLDSLTDKKEIVGGPFSRVDYEQMNLNSSDQVKGYLFANGWVPDEWNYKVDQKTGFVVKDEEGNPIKTSPKLTESSFDTVQGDVPRLLARRNVLMHRKRMLKNVRKTDGEETGWLNQLRDDGRISACAIPNGTNTGRFIHKNIVNVPGVDAVYGADIRSLFVVPEGYKLVGVDAAALEARMQAHYVYPYPGGHELADLLINGDIHQSNADMWGCTRKQAKGPYYCLMYGGQPPKLAMTMGCSLKDAKDYYSMFWDQYVPLTMLKEDLTKSWESRGGKKGGYVKGIDGRKLFARSPHSLVNLMFQSAGSITVKYATIFLDKYIKSAKLEAYQVIHMHDEFQLEVKEEHTDEVRRLALKAFEDAGKYLKMNVPILGDAKVGINWRDTH